MSKKILTSNKKKDIIQRLNDKYLKILIEVNIRNVGVNCFQNYYNKS